VPSCSIRLEKVSRRHVCTAQGKLPPYVLGPSHDVELPTPTALGEVYRAEIAGREGGHPFP
jgi:hypothetical protein